MSLTRSFLKSTFNQDNDDWDNSRKKHFNAIFSDDEDEPPQGTFSRWFSPQHDPLYIDPVLSSATYHVHQADNALLTLKHVVNENEGWKKALKHKSGVMVHMKNGLHRGDKTPIFKGEAIIHGFSPQAIFYVVGMRKLWDEQYEDGNLVENLNDTTSLTYESMKPTAASKARDLALVEKIECTQTGTIVFACTSVETPRIPRVSGKTRANIKLSGWTLEPLHGATKVTFVIQESIKGWVPGFAKKSLARRPLVIAKVAEYLEKKTERMRQQQYQQSYHRRPSVMSSSNASLPHRKSPENNVTQKHISFADQTNTSKPLPPTPPKHQLYSSHRHPINKIESIQLLKRITSSLENWDLAKELDDGKTRYYLAIDDEETHNRKMPFIRADSVIEDGWTAEQLCSVIHCYGSRKIWDASFEGGRTIERFSQKEYLVQWFLGSMVSIASVDLSAITSIETDPDTGTVFTATTSVTDEKIPPDESGHCVRAYTDLYGWVFKPSFDKNGRTLYVQVSFVCNLDFRYTMPSHVFQSWMDKSLQSINNIHHYLNQYGCPPYIRRVAGKVLEENFDILTSQYKIVFISKHQPSSSYRARKQHQPNSLWCTDIRFHETVFSHGLDIITTPEIKTRVQVSFSGKSIKIFTTSADIDGKQVTFKLSPLEHHDFTTYRHNGELVYNQKMPLKRSISEDKGIGLMTASEPSTPNATSFGQVIVDGDLSVSSTSTTASTTKPPSISKILTVSNGKPSPVKKKEEKRHSIKETLKIPEGYLLVPEHQNTNIIILTDELSFNGQQIAVIFIVMVVCYYMGKFTSCNSC